MVPRHRAGVAGPGRPAYQDSGHALMVLEKTDRLWLVEKQKDEGDGDWETIGTYTADCFVTAWKVGMEEHFDFDGKASPTVEVDWHAAIVKKFAIHHPEEDHLRVQLSEIPYWTDS